MDGISSGSMISTFDMFSMLEFVNKEEKRVQIKEWEENFENSNAS